MRKITLMKEMKISRGTSRFKALYLRNKKAIKFCKKDKLLRWGPGFRTDALSDVPFTL